MGGRANHVCVHELIGLVGDHPAVRFNCILADDGCSRCINHCSHEPTSRLLQGDLEGEIVDDARLFDNFGDEGGSPFGEIHRDHAIPGELHVVRSEIRSIVEDDALSDWEGVGEPVFGNQTVLLRGDLRRERGNEVRPLYWSSDECLVRLNDRLPSSTPGFRSSRIKSFGFATLCVHELSWVFDFARAPPVVTASLARWCRGVGASRNYENDGEANQADSVAMEEVGATGTSPNSPEESWGRSTLGRVPARGMPTHAP